MASVTPSSLVVLHQSFAVRMKQACDANEDIPAMNDGRLVWLRTKMSDEGHDVALQTIMRWYYGAAMPRQAKMIALAKVLGVSPSWLSLGRNEPFKVDTTIRNINPEGAVNALAGHMQMAGIPCAFPDGEDSRSGAVHFYSIIKGRQHPIHVTSGDPDRKQGSVHFRVPSQHSRLVVMVVIPTSLKSIEVWHIPSDTIESAAQRDSDSKVVTAKVSGRQMSIGRHKITSIEAFDQALVG